MSGVAQDASGARFSRVRWLVAMGFVVAAGLIAVLSWEVRVLRPQAAELMARRSFPYESQWVPTVRAVTLRGDSVTIGETTPGRTQVLIAFSVTCPHSLASLPAWKRISAALLGDSARRTDVYWLSASPRDSTAAYVQAHGITGPVVFPPDHKMLSVYRIKGTPLTVVLDRWGRVTHVHPSVLASAADVDSILVAARRTNAENARPGRASQDVSPR